jgi:hypothetical protein
MSTSSDSAPNGAGAINKSNKNKIVGINKGCKATERKLASRVFKE